MLPNVNDRYLRIKSFCAKRPICCIKSRNNTPVTRCRTFFKYDADIKILDSIPFPRILDRIQGNSHDHRWAYAHPGGPGCTNGLVRFAVPWHGIPGSRRKNKPHESSDSLDHIRDYIRDIEGQISSVLLVPMVHHLALGPAGMGFFALIGKLKNLHDAGKLDELKGISGASAGAIAGAAWIATKGNCQDIMTHSVGVNMEEKSKLNISAFFTNYGFINTDELMAVFREMLTLFTGVDDPTFAQLYAHNPVKFYVATFCMTTGQTVYFSESTHPDVKVSVALAASSAVPFMFTSVSIDGKLYMDGGTQEMIPALPFLAKNFEHVLGISVSSKKNVEEIKNIRDYVRMFVTSVLRNRIQYDIPTVTVDLGNTDIFNFKMKDADKLKLFADGYNNF